MSEEDIVFGDGTGRTPVEVPVIRAVEPAREPADQLPAEPGSEIEQEARAKGWVNAEEWAAQGKDIERHVDPETFLERGRQHPGILRKQIDDLNFEMHRMAQEQEAALVEARQIAFAEAAARIRADMQLAQEVGDIGLMQNAAQAETELAQLMEAPPQYAPPPQPFEPAMLDFLERSRDWWEIDPEKTQMAIALEGVLAQNGYSGPALYTELERRMNGAGPSRMKGLPTVEANARAGRAGSSMASQPAEVRRMFENTYWPEFKGQFKSKAEAEKKFLADMKEF